MREGLLDENQICPGAVNGDSGSGCGGARLCYDTCDNDTTYDTIYDNASGYDHAAGNNDYASGYDYTTTNDNSAGDNHTAGGDNSARPRCQNNNDGWL